MTYEFTAKSVPGGIVFLGREKERHDRLMSQFKGGKDVKVVYKPARRTRTLNQNSLYWQRNKDLSIETGYSKECLHEAFMQEAGYGVKVKTRTAELFFRQSSTELDTKQFSRLIELQDELALYLNEDREPDMHIILTTGDTT